jgi:hypothetical protein
MEGTIGGGLHHSYRDDVVGWLPTAGFGGLWRLAVCLMGGEGGGWASRIGGLVACILVGCDIALLMGVGPQSLPCSNCLLCEFCGGLWRLVTSAGLAPICEPISWPKCNGDSPLCSSVGGGWRLVREASIFQRPLASIWALPVGVGPTTSWEGVTRVSLVVGLVEGSLSARPSHF